ncbi:hypothetical protein OH76DRAFT_260992 [Lentinus brumalis]|uniref:Uncharacterized protein n=1 Tax=Lentinus brumalis TaxID=2498619 RepID=A0A371DGJ4_9APHY|nr:hypothetical protein OH76DRAFT_260992 [Polyporus brumalis]
MYMRLRTLTILLRVPVDLYRGLLRPPTSSRSSASTSASTSSSRCVASRTATSNGPLSPHLRPQYQQSRGSVGGPGTRRSHWPLSRAAKLGWPSSRPFPKMLLSTL